MKCWLDGADKETDTPVIDVSKSAFIKGAVERLTTNQLYNRGLMDIGKQMQDEIRKYNRMITRLANADPPINPPNKNAILKGGLDGSAN